MVLYCRSQPRASAGTRDHPPRTAAHRTAADRPTDLELSGWTSVCPSSRSGPTSLSFHSGGGRSCSVSKEETGSGNNSPPAESHFFPSSFPSPFATSTPVLFFPSAHCCLASVWLACDYVSSGFLRARPRRRSRPRGDLPRDRAGAAHRWSRNTSPKLADVN